MKKLVALLLVLVLLGACAHPFSSTSEPNLWFEERGWPEEITLEIARNIEILAATVPDIREECASEIGKILYTANISTIDRIILVDMETLIDAWAASEEERQRWIREYENRAWVQIIGDSRHITIASIDDVFTSVWAGNLIPLEEGEVVFQRTP
ncbi:MAG: hypothetical protein FWB76_02640 [Oscillospiraceae bacterium]|nr:hypothetical protein [Oscillospiraceae bacterium]